MARVPTSTSPTVAQSGETGGFSRDRATPEQFGAASARATRALGDTVFQAGGEVAASIQRFEKRQDDTSFAEGRVQYDAEVNNILYGDGVNTQGLFGLKGEDALAAAPQAQQAIDEAAVRAGEDRNPAVQQRLGLALGAAGNKHLGSISKFAGQERTKYDNELTDAMAKEHLDEVSRKYNDPEVVETNLAALRILALQKADRNGLPEEAGDVLANAAVSTAVEQAFYAALNQSDRDGAKKLLADHGSKVDPKIKAKMVKSMEESTDLASVQVHSDRIMTDATTTPTEKLAEARKIKDPKIRKDVVLDIKRRNTENAQAVKQTRTAAVANASNAITMGNQSYAAWGSRNPEEMALINSDPDAFKKIKGIEEIVAEGRNHAVTSDQKTMFDFRSMTPDQKAAMTPADVESLRGVTDADDFKTVTDQVAASKQAVATDKAKSAPYKRAFSILKFTSPHDSAFRARPRPGKTLGDDEVAEISAAQSAMDQFVHNFREVNQKWPSNSEMTAEARRLHTTFSEPDVFFKGTPFSFTAGSGDDVSFAELKLMSPEDRAAFKVKAEDLSPEFMLQSRNNFRNRGVAEPTDGQVTLALEARMLGEGYVVNTSTLSKRKKAQYKEALERAGHRNVTDEQIGILAGANIIDDRVVQRSMLRRRRTPATVEATTPAAAPAPAAAPTTPAVTPVAAPASATDIPKVTAPKAAPTKASEIETEDAEVKKFTPFLDVLGPIEGGSSGFEALAGGGKVEGATTMTISEVAKKAGTKAVGMWQNLGNTIVDRAKKIGLDPDKDTYSPENQAKIAIHLIRTKRGITDDMIKNDPDEAINRLAKEWAAIPVAKATTRGKKKIKVGESFYKGTGNNKALISVEEVKKALKALSS